MAYGIESITTENDKLTVIHGKEITDKFYNLRGWEFDGIFIEGDISQNDRMIKALEFLATNNGAKLQKSNF